MPATPSPPPAVLRLLPRSLRVSSLVMVHQPNQVFHALFWRTTEAIDERLALVSEFQITVIAAHSVRRLRQCPWKPPDASQSHAHHQVKSKEDRPQAQQTTSPARLNGIGLTHRTTVNNLRNNGDGMTVKGVNPMSWLQIAGKGCVGAIVEVPRNVLPNHRVDDRHHEEHDRKLKHCFKCCAHGGPNDSPSPAPRQ